MKRFRDYKAPPTDQGVLASPPLSGVADLLSANADSAKSFPDWLAELRRAGRQELLNSAIQYTSAYSDTDWVAERDAGRIVMAGHQPALFHPGVWFKNFALSAIAKKHNVIPINLVVDNDVVSGSSVRVPTLNRSSGRIGYEVVEFARGSGRVPYEQTEIEDRELFDSFGRRLADAIAPMVDGPAVIDLWPHAQAAIRRCGFAGCAMAQARHALESELGNQTLEIPVGVVSRGVAFSQFVVRLISGLDRFVEIYNRSLADYRTAHGIRSSAHPVPELAVETDLDGRKWVEAPLWVYGDDNPMRRQVWVCRSGDSIELSDRRDLSIRFDISDTASAVQTLVSRAGPDFKLRPRALLTTMFARLVLSDLFLHGIGGGKYDQLGDMISGEFFDITPPQFMVLSATIRLPVAPISDHANPIATIRRQIRDTVYQPERFADKAELPQSLIDRKRALLRSIPQDGPDQDWHRQMSQVNHQLASQLSDVRSELLDDLARSAQRELNRGVLQSREHSFALHPIKPLVESFNAMLAQVSSSNA